MATPLADTDGQDDQQYISTFFCRALYDYQSQDDSSLSFRKGDVIEVLTRLETGWWDGLLGDERGWFPSNYVAVISDEEADEALAAVEHGATPNQDNQPLHSSVADNSILDSTSETMSTIPSMSSIASSSSSMQRSLHSDDWADGEPGYEAPRRRAQYQPRAVTSAPSQSSDFWVPTMSQDGQIYYVNTQTGQQSRDLPVETEDELSEGDYSGLSAQQRGRSGSTTVFGRANGASSRSNGSLAAGFGVPKRSGTPEPWVRRLADDGLSYYYLNKIDGTMQWTMPEPDPSSVTYSSSSHSNGNGTAYGVSHSSTSARQPELQRADSRLRSGSSASNALRGRSDSATGYTSAYSDDSDVDPLDRRPSAFTSHNLHSSTTNGTRQPPVVQPSRTPIQTVSELTAAEKMAQTLQQSLSPTPPESVTDMSGLARQSVAAVIDYIQAHGVSNQPLQQRELSIRILDAVASIRNLLCISSPAYGHISSSLYPKDGLDPRANAFSQAIQAQLKPAQRKVTATLSKLVLAELAANYDASGFTSDAPSRMVADAQDLDKAIITFVMEVQRSNSQMAVQPPRSRPTAKRLRAALSPSNIGLGLVGAGAAATWKGFGWVAIEPPKDMPPRALAPDATSELKSFVDRAHERLGALAQTFLGTASLDQIHLHSRNALAALHSALLFVASINIAGTVDIDGINRDGVVSNEDIYMQCVQKARVSVRTLEAVIQAVYDDSAAILLVMQSNARSRPATVMALEPLVHAITTNLGTLQQTIQALLHIGQDQSDMAQNDYRESIKWRTSRVSMIDSSFGRTLHELSSYGDSSYPEESEDVVGFEDAFRKPPPSKPVGSIESSTLYGTDPSLSESYTEGSHRRGDSAATTTTWQRPGHKPSDSIDSFAASAEMVGDDDDLDLGITPATKTPSSSKVLKLLGEAPKHYVQTLTAESQPWYLRPNYGNDIQIDPDGKVRAGTVPALVERLTAHENSDTTFSKTFLLTYKSFTDIDTLFELLQKRFWIKPPDNLSPEELEDWTKMKQHVIRTRVLNTFKTMVTDEDILEKDDLHVLDRMKEMLQNEEVMRSPAAKQLMVLIERAQKGDSSRPKTTISLDPQPPPIVPKPSKKTKLSDFDPLEIARQLTMIECQLYQKIKPSECLLRSRESKGDSNDNIAAIIETTNKIAYWVADSVLSKQDSRKRAVIVKHFINVADRCRNLHNFSSMIAIVSGLNSTPIRRLKRTWEQINQRSMTLLGACEMTIDSNKNFNNYRQLLARITPPCVPFIGTYLTTLTFIQDGAPNNIGELVNFRKRQKSAETIDEIKKWQSKPFNFARVDVIYDYIQECLNKFNAIPDVDDLFWNLSLEREPREREDEKMARLLQETGFL